MRSPGSGQRPFPNMLQQCGLAAPSTFPSAHPGRVEVNVEAGLLARGSQRLRTFPVPMDQWHLRKSSPLTVAGAATVLRPDGYVAPCSLLIPVGWWPSRNLERPHKGGDSLAMSIGGPSARRSTSLRSLGRATCPAGRERGVDPARVAAGRVHGSRGRGGSQPRAVSSVAARWQKQLEMPPQCRAARRERECSTRRLTAV
jgi:hypothetical protein